MLVRFWGTRGSLPVAPTATDVRAKLATALVRASGRTFADEAEAGRFLDDQLRFAERATYGGATSCVEIETTAPSYFVCDLGSGVRSFALDSLRRNAGGHAKTYNLFLSHLHWDHIMGFPFFVPAFAKDVTIRIFAGHGDAETALRRQQEEISFPVPFDWLAAKIEFVTMVPGTPLDIDGVRVDIIEQKHSHVSYGYRFTDGDGRSAVYSTDSEHKPTDMADEEAFIAFIRDADLVICDTMYSLGDTVSLNISSSGSFQGSSRIPPSKLMWSRFSSEL